MPLNEAQDKASDQRIAATQAVFAIAPTSLVAMRAKIDFATSVDHVTDLLRHTETVELLGSFLDTLYEAARPMVVQS